MTAPRISRRDVLRSSGGLVIGFSLTAAFARAGITAQEPTIAPELGTPAAEPTVEPGLVATPSNQTQQDVQTRNVEGDTVDSWLEIAPDGSAPSTLARSNSAPGSRRRSPRSWPKNSTSASTG